MENRGIAIITARGGSKRIPKKNIKSFLGVPIIKYSIEAALTSNIFEEVMVSTDDEEIAEVAKTLGASVPFLRSEKTSDDYATTADVLQEVLNSYINMGITYSFACCIYPTAPFISVELLRKAYALMADQNADTIMSVTRFSYPIWRSFRIKSEKLEYIWPENMSKRSQDLEPAFHDCGQFYFFRVKKFLETGNLINDATFPIEIPESYVQDIDTEEDWKMAELKYQALLNNKSWSPTAK